MNTVLRSANSKDYPVIASWITDAAACARWAGPLLPYPFDVSVLADLLQKPDSASLVLVDEFDATLGYSQYWKRDDRRVHIGRIIVSPLSRGKGWGKILCQGLMQHALAGTGLPVISLRVFRDNLAAQRLYHQLGFVDVPADSNLDVLAMEYDSATVTS